MADGDVDVPELGGSDVLVRLQHFRRDEGCTGRLRVLARAVQLERGVLADFKSGGTVAALPRETAELLDALQSVFVA